MCSIVKSVRFQDEPARANSLALSETSPFVASPVQDGRALTSRPSLVEKATQIVAGVVLKWVNFAKGWQQRLLVLQNDVARYYKVQGEGAVDVFKLFEHLRSIGDLHLVGVEAVIWENKWKKQSRYDATLKEPAGGIHLQVSKVTESKSDARRFRIHTGTKLLVFRTADMEERWKWVSTLKDTQATWSQLSSRLTGALSFRQTRLPSDTSVQSVDDSDKVRMELLSMGASEDIVKFVEKTLTSKTQEYEAALEEERSKRTTLLKLISSLTDSRNELEATLAVGGLGGSVSRKASGGASSLDLDDTVRQWGEDGGASVAGEDAENGSPSEEGSDSIDLDADIFVECDPNAEKWADRLSRLSAGSSGSTASARRTKKEAKAAASKLVVPMTVAQNETAARPPPEWVADEGLPPVRRVRLPPPDQTEKPVSLWAIIKEMVGKDLTRVCLPVFFNEPLSALQKIAEDLEYSELLDKASCFPKGSHERLLYVSAFAVSGYSSTSNRTNKPFNPLLGETFELVHSQKHVRFLAEKVCHHPTIIAAHVEANGWVLQGDAELKSKFWGRSIEVIPEGVLRVTFEDGDMYQWNKVSTYINNLIIGKLYIDHGGIMKVTNLVSGMLCRIRFKETGMFYEKNPRQVRGHIETASKEKLDKPVFHGNWDNTLYADMPDGSTWTLWTKSPAAVDPTRYGFSTWAIQLNEVTPGLEEKLAPTDCRLRPDQHYLELGCYDEANAEKQRLEEKQRAARRAAERGDPIQPRWFDPVDSAKQGKEITFQYKGGYWESRKKGKYEGCRDIFGQTVAAG